MSKTQNRRSAVEDDLRQPAYKGVNVDEYEVDEHGAVVRKDRWEMSVRDAIIALQAAFPTIKPLDSTNAVNLATAVEHAIFSINDERKNARAAKHLKQVGEPVGWYKSSELDTARIFGGSFNVWPQKFDNDTPIYAKPATIDFEEFKEKWKQAHESNKGFKYIDPMLYMFDYVKGKKNV